jgi:hypothetical protein
VATRSDRPRPGPPRTSDNTMTYLMLRVIGTCEIQLMGQQGPRKLDTANGATCPGWSVRLTTQNTQHTPGTLHTFGMKSAATIN